MTTSTELRTLFCCLKKTHFPKKKEKKRKKRRERSDEEKEKEYWPWWFMPSTLAPGRQRQAGPFAFEGI